MYVRTYVCKLCLLVTTQQDESSSLAPKIGKQFQGGECLILNKAKKAQEGSELSNIGSRFSVVLNPEVLGDHGENTFLKPRPSP